MELSAAVVKTLKAVAGNDSPVERAALKDIVKWTLKELATGCRTDPPAGATEGDDVGMLLASVHSAVGMFFLEAAKANVEENELAETLESLCGWRDAKQISVMTSQWAATLPMVRTRLRSLQLSHPAIEACSWTSHHQLGDREVEPATKSQAKHFFNFKLSDGSAMDVVFSPEQLQVLEEKLCDMLHEASRVHSE